MDEFKLITSMRDITPFSFVNFGKGYNNQPITWRVLRIEKNHAFLFADNFLAGEGNKLYMSKVFSHSTATAIYGDTSNVWRKSEIYKWLNKDFLRHAFTWSERIAITKTKYLTKKHNSNDYYTDKSKIFLLSLSEINTYKQDMSMLATKPDGFGWWLRDPGRNPDEVLRVMKSGQEWIVNNAHVNELLEIRPAIVLKLSNRILYHSSFKLKKHDK